VLLLAATKLLDKLIFSAQIISGQPQQLQSPVDVIVTSWRGQRVKHRDASSRQLGGSGSKHVHHYHHHHHHHHQ